MSGHAHFGSGGSGGPLRDIELDLKLDVVLQHVGGVEPLLPNHGAVLIEVRLSRPP